MKGDPTDTLPTMYDHIVIAVDGGDESRRAARGGLLLARAFDATVDVVYVVEGNLLRLAQGSHERSVLEAGGEDALREIEELATNLDHPVTTALTEGDPAVEISDYASEQGADLIVVGRQGLTGLGRRLLGGVTEQVLHRSDVPVLVVPGREFEEDQLADYSRVLLTTDGSENAEVAIPHATAIARRFEAAVHVLNVVDLQASIGLFNAGGLDDEFVERLDAGGRDAVDAAAARIEEAAPELTIETAVERTSTYEGAAAGVREYVERNGIDLVVMSSHGRSNLTRQLLGSVASTVVRTVDVPVLVVRRRA